ncbi:hypothetical protein [Enterobacter hormaechei]|uniref:hypothetical protein n=1 Tax=Enterobacter hormaechei TaxID=158836 RepID=UPI003F42A34E
MTKADAQATLKDNNQIEELAKYYQTSQSTITSGLRFLASDGERGCKFEDKRKNSYALEALAKMAKAGIKPVTPKAEPVKPKVDTKY